MNFTFNSSISIGSNGGMVIRNGSQVIKMGREGMIIESSNGQQILMNSGGIHLYNRNSHVFVNSSCSNGSINIQTVFKNSNNTNDESEENRTPIASEPLQREVSTQSREESQLTGFNYQITNNNMMWHLSQFRTLPESQVVHIESYPRPEPVQRKRLTKAQIDKLPINLYNSKAKKVRMSQAKKNGQKNVQCCESSSNEVCAICILDYQMGDKLRTLPCQHKFHQGCVDKWLGLKSDCPICKFDLLG